MFFERTDAYQTVCISDIPMSSLISFLAGRSFSTFREMGNAGCEIWGHVRYGVT